MALREIREDSFYLQSFKNRRFYVKRYDPAGKKPKAILQIIHGMAEHGGRYHDFACFLAKNGYAVVINDHPGHGKTAENPEELGVIPKKRGWETLLENIRLVYSQIRKNQPEIPVYLFGHSMGSILVRHFISVYPIYIQGLILSGTFESSPSLVKTSRVFTRIKCLTESHQHKSKWFNKFFYWRFNRHFKPRPTRFEWISSERDEVDAYVEDPCCGIDCSNGFYTNLFKGIKEMKRAEATLKYRKNLPLLILSGQQDAVGNFGKDALNIHKRFFKQKFQNLTLKVFHGRHELLHESNKEEVYYFLLNWLEEHLATR